MIDLKQLIQVSQFPEDVTQDILNQLPSLSEAKKFALAELAWTTICQRYENDLQLALHTAALETAQGKRTLTPEEIQKIQDNLFKELANKFNAAEDQEQLQGIREKLEQAKQKNPSNNP